MSSLFSGVGINEEPICLLAKNCSLLINYIIKSIDLSVQVDLALI